MPRPRNLKDVQQALGERVKELPVHAARLTVTGIGHVLLLSDRIRKEAKEVRAAGVGPTLGRLRDDAGRLVGKVADRVGGPPRVPPRTGTAATRPGAATTRPDRPDVAAPRAAAPPTTSAPAKPAVDKAADTAPPAKPTTKPSGKAEPAGTTKPATKPAGKAGAKAKPATKATAKPSGSAAGRKAADAPKASELPITDYDDRSVPSLRSRLRGLSADQVAQLRDYERAHAKRPDVLRMYDNRIDKLKAGG
jgi:hypothetical protein